VTTVTTVSTLLFLLTLGPTVCIDHVISSICTLPCL